MLSHLPCKRNAQTNFRNSKRALLCLPLTLSGKAALPTKKGFAFWKACPYPWMSDQSGYRNAHILKSRKFQTLLHSLSSLIVKLRSRWVYSQTLLANQTIRGFYLAFNPLVIVSNKITGFKVFLSKGIGSNYYKEKKKGFDFHFYHSIFAS